MEALAQVLKALETDRRFSDNVTRWESVPSRSGVYAPLPEALDGSLVTALAERGITQLYSHQRESFDAVMEGKNIVVVTPTASGKSLCYNLPVLQYLLGHSEARALYLFPTKALSQDQQSELNDVIAYGRLPLKVSTYDGDTPSSLRVSARSSGRIVITNPDMLHAGILPNHPKWIKFLSHLQFIVIDEIHTYTGIFGSHMTNLLRRVKRIAQFYGSSPVFICCSATIRNPGELAEGIIEETVLPIEKSGAPAGEKQIILYNPPLVDPVQGIRRGVVLEAKHIALRFIKEKIKTIVFAKSRVRTELIAAYINSSLQNLYTDNKRIRVEAYRGGYLPSQRRAIERGLRQGEIHGVVSTNALELGIDIGDLEAAVLAGFPGSIASVWQQAGRAGRRNKLSAAVIVASASPTDQYLVRHPEYFFSRSPESGWINPDNIFILTDHLKCAVFELPFSKGDTFGGKVDEFMELLEEEGTLRYTGGKWFWADRSYPAEHISLRSSTPENIVIINTTKGKNEVIGEMDLPSAKELLFDNAVYIHQGVQYISKKLDVENRCCHVEESNLNYYTDSVVKTDIKLLSEDAGGVSCGVSYILGDVLVRSQTAKFKKIKFGSHENIGYGEIFLPEEEMHTRSAVLYLKPGTPAGEAFEGCPVQIREKVLASAGTLIKNTAPVFLLCSIHDIGIVERLKDFHAEYPAFYLYDSAPGGSGLSEGFIAVLEEILRAAFDSVSSCPCERGCPSCIGADYSGAASAENVKMETAAFFKRWLPER